MTEHKDTKHGIDPRDQAAAQTTDQNAAPGEPGHYTAPSVDSGVTKSQPNEVKAAEPGDQTKDHKDEDYDALTVPELKELAEKRGIESKHDWLKEDYVKSLKKT